MAERKLFFTVGADIGPGSKAFSQFGRDAKKSMQDVDNAVDDTRTNAQRVADALDAIFENVDATLLETKETAEILGRAMGPELSAKVDSTAAVQEFQRLGLTLEEIRGDADRLADTLRRADDVSLRHIGDSAGGARTQVDGLRDSSDQSRSVLANMVGNSAQDLGEFGGVVGTAGVALGQLGEYAVDGNIKLAQLAKVAGPMALVTAAGLAISTSLKRAKEEAERMRQEVEDFTQALLQGGDAASQFADELERTGKLEMPDLFGDMEDIADELQRSGISAKQFGDAVAGGAPALRALADAARQAGADGDDLVTILSVGMGAVKNYGEATERAARVSELLAAPAVEGLTDRLYAQQGMLGAHKQATGETAAATEGLGESQGRAAETAQRVTDNMRAQAEQLAANVDAMASAADANVAVSEAQEDFAAAVAESNKVQGDAESTAADVDAAVDAERDAMIDAARAAQRLKEEQAKANGVNLTAKDRLAAFNNSLLNNAHYATPAARSAIADYIIEANGIPEEKATEIRALIEQGKLAEAEAAINNASRAREAAISADARNVEAVERELNNLARDRWANIRTVGGGTGGSNRAEHTGGVVTDAHEGRIIGRTGAEEFWTPDNFTERTGRIHSTEDTRRMGGSQQVIVHEHLTINQRFGPGQSDREITRAIDRYRRRSGRS